MINSLKLQSIEDNQENPHPHPQSQPPSPSKYPIKKQISAMSERNHPPTLWRESSLSLTRDKSPCHKIPNSIRFRGKEADQLKMQQYGTLELRRDIKSERGVRFAKSHRPEHFVKGLGSAGPSPASYTYSRFMEEPNFSTLSVYNYNPEQSSTSSNKLSTSDLTIEWAIKGRSFSNFNNHHKAYIPHSKHRFYQPQQVQGHPGPGHYQHSWVNKHKKQSYSMRIAMKRFNETSEYVLVLSRTTPGPGTYGVVNSQRVSPNVKGTMARSGRTYLTKFQANPSPGHYKVTRFLEK